MWLPERAAEPNPMDTLSGQAKGVVAANKQDATIEDRVNRPLPSGESRGPAQAEGSRASGTRPRSTRAIAWRR